MIQRPAGDQNAVWNVLGRKTVGWFLALTNPDKIKFINDLWGAIVERHPFDKLAEEMYEPAGNVPADDKAPLPTSWDPSHQKRLRDVDFPWQQFAVGFRVCGRTQDDVTRTLSDGCTQQRLVPALMHTKGFSLREPSRSSRVTPSSGRGTTTSSTRARSV
jgi:hypothetical protein